jgi:membrane associated rhomboid family serine protease
MAFRSNGPITLGLPPFRGVTRRIILIALVVFFGALALGIYSGELAAGLLNFFVLHPDKALKPLIWQLVTYPFVAGGLLSLLFGLLSFWFFGAALEDERGSRWLSEYFLVVTIGGALVASVLSLASGGHVPGLLAQGSSARGIWPAVLALIVAFAVFHPEQELNFNFIFKIKAKYLAAIYVLLYLALSLGEGDRFGALVALCNAGAGYGFLKLAPRRGVRVGMSERWFMLRNSYQRAKRRRAAKKFTVYMRKQGKDVSLDADGRYIDPDGTARDLNDKRWMN